MYLCYKICLCILVENNNWSAYVKRGVITNISGVNGRLDELSLDHLQ